MDASILGRTDAEILAWESYVLGSSIATGYHQAGWRRVIEEAFGHPTYYLKVHGQDGVVQGFCRWFFWQAEGLDASCKPAVRKLRRGGCEFSGSISLAGGTRC
jgi:hypothetical protein